MAIDGAIPVQFTGSAPTPRGQRRLPVWVVVGSVVGIAIVLAIVVWTTWFQTYHFETVAAGQLYRDGNRDVREFGNMIREAKPKTVVCLVDDNEVNDPAKPQFKAEFDLLARKGIKLERIPVTLGGWPSSADVQRFLEIASDKSNAPVLVHCAQGVRRTGFMVAAYQRCVLGYDVAKTKESIATFGHSNRSIGDVEKFVDVFDPATRELKQSMENSGNID